MSTTAWTSLTADYGYDSQINGLVEYSGKIYGIGGSSTLYQYDSVGGAWISVASPWTGYDKYGWGLIEYSGSLYGYGTVKPYSYSPFAGALYVWNGVNAWVLVDSIAFGGSFISAVELSGDLFFSTAFPYSRLYKYSGGFSLVSANHATETSTLCIVVKGSEIFAGTGPNGKLLKSDGASSWVDVDATGIGGYLYDIKLMDGYLYAVGSTGKLHRSDGASVWSTVAPYLSYEHYCLAIVESDLTVYAGNGNGELDKWVFGDSAWTKLCSKLGTEWNITALLSTTTEVYGGTYSNALLYSVDLPATIAITEPSTATDTLTVIAPNLRCDEHQTSDADIAVWTPHERLTESAVSSEATIGVNMTSYLYEDAVADESTILFTFSEFLTEASESDADIVINAPTVVVSESQVSSDAISMVREVTVPTITESATAANTASMTEHALLITSGATFSFGPTSAYSLELVTGPAVPTNYVECVLPSLDVIVRTGAISSAALPKFSVEVAADQAELTDIAATLPSFLVSSVCGAKARSVLSKFTVDADLSVTKVAEAIVKLPLLSVSASALTTRIADIEALMPNFKVTSTAYYAAPVGITAVLPQLNLQSEAVSGVAMEIEAELPSFDSECQMYSNQSVDIDAELPSFDAVLFASLTATVSAPNCPLQHER